MPISSDKQRLLEILVELYPSPEDIVRLAADAGIDSSLISFGGEPRRIWYSLLNQAEKRQRVASLIEVAQRDYPRNERLRQLRSEVGGDQRHPGKTPSRDTAPTSPRPIRIFISYSRQDEVLRDQLEINLSVLRRRGEIEVWHDQMISVGENRQEALKRSLEQAELILLLVSPDYLASRSTYKEMETALRFQQEGRARVIPIILRPVELSSHPLAQLQWLPRGGIPVIAWKSRDEAWVNILEGLRNVINYALRPPAPAHLQETTLSPRAPQARPDPGGTTAYGLESFLGPSPLDGPLSRDVPPRQLLPIGDIFRRGRQPDITFVEPSQLQALKVHLRTMGQGLVIEGPSGIGKTTAANKAREAVAPKLPYLPIQSLQAKDVTALDKALADGFTGHLIVDDFHHLDSDRKRAVANAIKALADSNREDAKITVIGINPVGVALMKNFPDLAGRYDVVSMSRQPDERIAKLIQKGEEAAQVIFRRRDEFITAAAGSFFTAQQLCFHACLAAEVQETQLAPLQIDLGVREVLDAVMASLGNKYRQPLRDFSAYDKELPRPGACLTLLWLLSRDGEGFVSLDEASLQFPMLAESFGWLRREKLKEAFTLIPDLARLFFFDPRAGVLSAEDPQLHFYLRYLPWLDFARKSGHTRIKLDADGGLVFPYEVAASAVTIPAAQRPAEEGQARVGSATGLPSSTVLHLSDLHFGTEEQALLWYEQLAEDLREQQCTELDAVILSGDIANRSTPEEFAAARVFLEKLMKEFQLAPRRLVMVPGNHDLNWELSRKAYSLHRRAEFKGSLGEGLYIDHGEIVEVRDESAYRLRFEPFSSFYQQLKQVPYPLEYAQQAILQHFPEKKLLVLGLNSAWQIDHAFKARTSIHSGALSSALSTLRTAPEYADTLKIAVWHHPIAGEGEDQLRDHGFLERLAQAGFRIALHGHIHTASNDLFRYDMTLGGRRIDLVSAGTFGAPVAEWVPGYPLGYNLLRISGDRVVVETRRREALNGTWKPDARWLQGQGKDPLPRYEIKL